MDKLKIAASGETPLVEFDGDKGVFIISGKSYPENVNDFYSPVFDYLDAYIKTPQTKTTLRFNWLYYNTSTAKVIVRIIMLLNDSDTELGVEWICKEGFDLIAEKGEEIRDVLGVNMQIVNL